MLRLLVLALVLANLGFFAWTQGWLDEALGVRAQGDREPTRLSLQVNPELIKVLPPQTAGEADADSPPVNVCLEAGPYTASQVWQVEASLLGVIPANRWVNLKSETPAVWVIYIGQVSDADVRAKKIDELKRLRVPFEDIRNLADLGAALTLGRFSERASAENALASLKQLGVRSARIMQLTPSVISHVLRIEQVDAHLQAQLNGLQGQAMMGRAFKACNS